MRKKDCIYSLNEILEYISENEVFEEISKELNIPEDELEIIVSSIIIDRISELVPKTAID